MCCKNVWLPPWEVVGLYSYLFSQFTLELVPLEGDIIHYRTQDTVQMPRGHNTALQDTGHKTDGGRREGGSINLGKVAMWSVQCAVCRVQFTVCIMQCAVCRVLFTVCSVQCSVFSIQCSVFSVQCSVFSVQCNVWSVQCSVFSIQCAV